MAIFKRITASNGRRETEHVGPWELTFRLVNDNNNRTRCSHDVWVKNSDHDVNRRPVRTTRDDDASDKWSPHCRTAAWSDPAYSVLVFHRSNQRCMLDKPFTATLSFCSKTLNNYQSCSVTSLLRSLSHAYLLKTALWIIITPYRANIAVSEWFFCRK